MNVLNEFSQIKEVAIRSPLSGFIDDEKLSTEWEALRFHSKPDLNQATMEYNYFRNLLQDDGINIIDLPSSKLLTIDSIYTRDSILISQEGLILCNMGRSSRTPEAMENFNTLASQGYEIAGQIEAPGTLEGGDFIWIDDCVNVVLWLLQNPNVSGLFNCGTGKARSFKDLVKAIYDAMGKEVDINYVPTPEQIRDKYQYFTQANMDKLKSLGYDMKFTTLENGVTQYVRDYLMGDDHFL